MVQLEFESLAFGASFSENFVPGANIFASYQFSQSADEISFVGRHFDPFYNPLFDDLPSGSEIDPTVTVSGPDLTVGTTGVLSGTITEMTFLAPVTGQTLSITNTSFDGAQFSQILENRTNGDLTANEQFFRFVGEGIGPVQFPDSADYLTLEGFVEFLGSVNMGGGNDFFSSNQPIQTDFTVDGGAGFDTLRLSRSSEAAPIVVNLQTGTVTSGENSFRFIGFERILAGGGVQEFIGSDRADQIIAGSRDDIASGAGGNDFINGWRGNDSLSGEAGFDTLIGGSGDDTLSGGDLADTLDGGEGDDLIFGGQGFDNIMGRDGNDTINGGASEDRAFGGAGDDLLFGDAGNDRFFGGIGNDSIYGGSGNDTVLAGPGSDTVFGDSGFDVLNGGAGDDMLDGGSQADNIFGGDGNDTMIGGQGLDRLFGGFGDDEGRGGEGNDGLFGLHGDDLLFGEAGNDRFFGGIGTDTIDGGADNDTVFAGAGFDTITGGTGDDLLWGNFNADRFVFADGHGADTIADFAATNGFERIDLSAIAAITDLSDLLANHAAQSGADVLIDTGTDQQITLLNVDLKDLDATDFVF